MKIKNREIENIYTRTKQKIFFTDLDGTLLTTDKQVSPATWTVLEQWTAKGNLLALSSGRATDSIRDVQRALNLYFPGMYLIGYNGGEIYDCDRQKVVSRISLTMEETAAVMETAHRMGIHCHTYTDTHIITPAINEQLRYYQHVIITPVICCENVLEALDQPPCKCIAIELYDKQMLENFRLTLQSEMGDKLSLLYSNDKYLEIFPVASGKGAALQTLSALLNIPIKNTLAAGDEINDISMLQAAGLGIAMKNARDCVKEAADRVTETDNDEDGLVNILMEQL
ncbi:MAG: HAD family phosphatase [Lachnospiraceae bacterium]|nr:HAD family phosphatase [Lachnospiraceae bacterium]